MKFLQRLEFPYGRINQYSMRVPLFDLKFLNEQGLRGGSRNGVTSCLRYRGSKGVADGNDGWGVSGTEHHLLGPRKCTVRQVAAPVGAEGVLTRSRHK